MKLGRVLSMNKKTLYEEYIEDKEFERLMAQEDLIMDVTENFCALLEEEKINKSTLAKIMGKTKGYISQLLNGGKNLTLRSMADVAFSLGYIVRVTLTKKEATRDVNSFITSVKRRSLGWRQIVPRERVHVVADGYKSASPADKLAA